MMKIKAVAAAVLVTLSAGAFAAAPTTIIEEMLTTATGSGKTFAGTANWSYGSTFDLNLNLFGKGTDFYSFTLTGPGFTETSTKSYSSSAAFDFNTGWTELDAGSYTFSYFGTAKKGSVAGLTLSSSIAPLAPVPEPETYAMLLAGLGLMGAIAKRRKDKQA
jgi:hypothetical protein